MLVKYFKSLFKFNVHDRGFLWGIFLAMIECGILGIGFILYELIGNIRSGNNQSILHYFLEFLGMIYYGSLFTSIPAGIGGWFMALFLQRYARKGSLTIQKAIITGAFSGGLVGSVICLCIILFIMIVPHNGLQLLLDDILSGNWINYLPNIFLALFEMIVYFWWPILIVDIFACLGGGLVGWNIAKYLLRAENKGLY